MQIQFDWVNPLRVGRNGYTSSGITVSRNDYKDKNGSIRISTVVRFAPDVMKKARFVIGDRVMVGIARINEDRFLAVRRVTEGGYAISGPSARKGKASNGHVKIHTENLPLGQYKFHDVQITEEGILLSAIDKRSKNGKA